MKNIIAILLIFSLSAGCKKNSSKSCTDAVVTLVPDPCKHVSVIFNGKTYSTDDLPDQYAVEGKNICIEYSLYEDVRLCVCCGGTKAHIIAVH